jgi:hypothetical protein
MTTVTLLAYATQDREEDMQGLWDSATKLVDASRFQASFKAPDGTTVLTNFLHVSESLTPARAKLLKPSIILDELLNPKAPEGWVLYCDADCRWARCPDFLEILSRDMTWRWPVLATLLDHPIHRFHHMWPSEWAEVIPAVLLFPRGDEDTLKLVRMWKTACDEDPGKPEAGDQEHLQAALADMRLFLPQPGVHRKDGRLLGHLGEEWCWIEGISQGRYGDVTPLITHPAPKTVHKG